MRYNLRASLDHTHSFAVFELILKCCPFVVTCDVNPCCTIRFKILTIVFLSCPSRLVSSTSTKLSPFVVLPIRYCVSPEALFFCPFTEFSAFWYNFSVRRINFSSAVPRNFTRKSCSQFRIFWNRERFLCARLPIARSSVKRFSSANHATTSRSSPARSSACPFSAYCSRTYSRTSESAPASSISVRIACDNAPYSPLCSR